MRTFVFGMAMAIGKYDRTNSSLGMIFGAYVLLLSMYLWRFGVGYGDTNAWNVPQASLKYSRVAFPNTKLPELRSRGAV